MRLRAAILAVGLSAGAAQAGELHCSFTEPFFTIDYDSATGKVIYLSPNEVDDDGKLLPRTMAENAKIVREEASGEHEIFYLKAGEETLLTLKLTGRGSDGMSDMMFPFEATGMGPHAGGCETNNAPAHNISQFYEDFGIQF